jgi:hypothetical protein
MNIYWSEHASERAMERGFEGLTAPRAKITRIARLVELGEEFHIKEPLFTWVCKRLTDQSVMLVTVLHTVHGMKLPLQRRKQLHKQTRKRLKGNDYE